MAGTGSEFDKTAILADIHGAVARLRESLRQRYDNLAEDSYATRLETRNDLAFVAQFEQFIAKVKPDEELDLRRVGIDYGYDPEAAYADQSVGLEYVPGIERERSQYERDIHRVQPFIDRLEDAGIRVRRDFRSLWHEDHDLRLFGSDQVSLNRFLDMRTEAPALIDILYAVGAARLAKEERYERIDPDRLDLWEDANRELGFLTRLERAIFETWPGQTIDLRVVGISASDSRISTEPEFRNGLRYIQAGEHSKSIYDAQIAGIEKYRARLEKVGVTVLTGFRDELVKERAQKAVAERPKFERSQPEQPARLNARQESRPNGRLGGGSASLDATSYWARIASSGSVNQEAKLSQNEARTQHRGRSQ